MKRCVPTVKDHDCTLNVNNNNWHDVSTYICCNHQNRDEEGYTADESGSDWSTEEEQVSSAYITIDNKL